MVAAAQQLIDRLERLPVSPVLVKARLVVGTATFFDGFSTLAIAYVLPVLARDWNLGATEISFAISAGYLGQLVGALFFGWLAERIGRLPVLSLAVSVYGIVSFACVFAPGITWLIVLRFIQGLGTGGEVPVAGAYINEFVGAKRRGAFFLLYEVIFPVGLTVAGVCGYFFVPTLGWQTMFLIGAVPALLVIPLRFSLPESPRWLISKGRLDRAEQVVARLERGARPERIDAPPPSVIPATVAAASAPSPRETGFGGLFQGIYRRRTLMLWALWLGSYAINNGIVTWMPTLYRTVFHLPLGTSLGYGLMTSAFGVITSILCALYIDRVGRKRWYIWAFFLATIPLLGLALIGAGAPTQVLIFGTATYGILQTITFSLYLYTAELYPTRLRALGCGTGSAWLRLGSSLGPALLGVLVASEGLSAVFVVFAGIAAVGGLIVWRFGIETKGRVLEELSP